MNQATPSMSAVDLADRLGRDEAVTILDVRPEAEWPIEGPQATVVHIPADQVMAEPSVVSARLAGPVAVVCNRGLTAVSVAVALRASGTDAVVLEGGMRGWLAALQARPVELGLAQVQVLQVQRPGRGCLSYLIVIGGQALVVDPAPDTSFYLDLAWGLGAQITQVFDTHIHADHLSGARALAAAARAELRLPRAALERGVAYADEISPVDDGEVLMSGPPTVRALSLPGHTTDMTGLLIGDRALVAGDSVFADGIARPDLQRGDEEGAREMAHLLHRTLARSVLTLPGDTVLLPCHTHPGVHDAAVAPTLARVRAAVPELSIEDAERFADVLTADMPPRPANYEAIIAVNSGARPFDPELESGGNSCASR